MPFDLKTIKDIAFQMGVKGATLDEVRSMFNLEEEEVNILLSDAQFCDYLLNAQTACKVPIGKRLAVAAELAYNQRLKMLLDPGVDVKTKEKISGDFMDRALGRPIQRTESLNVNMTGSSDATDLQSLNYDLEQAQKRVKMMEDALASPVLTLTELEAEKKD